MNIMMTQTRVVGGREMRAFEKQDVADDLGEQLIGQGFATPAHVPRPKKADRTVTMAEKTEGKET